MKNVKNEYLIELRGGRPQEIVAAALGITRQMLSSIELGKRSPSLALAKKFADYYECSVEMIFFNQNSNEMLHFEKSS